MKSVCVRWRGGGDKSPFASARGETIMFVNLMQQLMVIGVILMQIEQR